jgi:hypothetical protein
MHIGALIAVAPDGSASEAEPTPAPTSNGWLPATTAAPPASVQPSAPDSKSPPGASA